MLSLSVALLSATVTPPSQAHLVPVLTLAGEEAPAPEPNPQPPPAASPQPVPSLALEAPTVEVSWRGVLASSGFLLTSDLLGGTAPAAAAAAAASYAHPEPEPGRAR